MDPAEALPDDPLGTRSIRLYFDLTCEFLLPTFTSPPTSSHQICKHRLFGRLHWGKRDQLHSLIVISP